MRTNKIDILSQEKRIDLSLNNVESSINLLKKTIIKATKMHDRLITEQKNTITTNKVRTIMTELIQASREARTQYTSAKECINGIAFDIQEALSSIKNIAQFQELKKLRTKNTNAKQQLKGYNINALEALANKTIERINRAMEIHYTVR